MILIRNKNLLFGLSAILLVLSIGSIAVFGLSLGTDFTGGSLVEVRYDGARPDAAALIANLNDAGFEGFSLRESGDNAYTLRAATLTDAERQSLPAVMSHQGGTAIIDQFTQVGPTIGEELRNKALVAVVLVALCILLFIAFAFRKVSKPISSWVYGLIALATLVFDVIVPLGAFALMGHLLGAEIDTLFITAILTIAGYSVHDTIVVFDRTRENLRINEEKGRKEPFEETAGRALSQTFVRSMNTSVTTLISLVALYLLGPESTKVFSLTLLVGIVAGTYSSIFLATPLLVAVEKWRAK